MGEASFAVRSDPGKNRLYITFVGFFSDALMEEACAKVEREAKRLSPGFSIVTDISRCKPTTPKGTRLIQQVQEYLSRLGVGRVVRVTSPESQIIKFQFQRQSEGLYQADTAASVTEAERMLDGKN